MSAAACSWRTSSGRIPSLMHEASARSIGPPMRKNRISVPSFLSERAKISEPVISAISSPPLDNPVCPQLLHLRCTQAEPVAKDLAGVLAQERRWRDRQRLSIMAHWPCRHFEGPAVQMLHDLHDPSALEIRIVLQLHCVEHGPGGHARVAEQAHRLPFIVSARPRCDQGVDLRLVIGAAMPDSTLAPLRCAGRPAVAWAANATRMYCSIASCIASSKRSPTPVSFRR